MNLEKLRGLIITDYKSQFNFSSQVGIPNSTLNDFLNGKCELGHKRLEKIFHALKMDIDALIESREQKHEMSNPWKDDLSDVFSYLSKVEQKSIVKTIEKELKIIFDNHLEQEVEQKVNRLKMSFSRGR